MIDKAMYIKAKGLICPFCNSESIEGGFIEVEAGEAFQKMNCSLCQNKWQDVYRLVDVVPLGKEAIWHTHRN
jgi:formate dehydrogenase maturation protein FdhE